MKKNLIIALLDLTNTCSQILMFEEILKQAYNKEITYVPLEIEDSNTIYYRHTCSKPAGRDGDAQGTYIGRTYKGLFDDQRAINAFIGESFNLIKLILADHGDVVILHSPEYANEANRLCMLIKGQQLEGRKIETKTEI